MKSILFIILTSFIFIQCTQDQEIFRAETWKGNYEIKIANKSTSLSPLIIDAAGNLTIDGTEVPYFYDVFTYTVTISDVTVNRTRIHFASLVFKQEGVSKTFAGEISTASRGTSGKITGRTGR